MRIGIVNDLRLAVESLRRTVAGIPGATVAWVAEDGAQAVARCAADRPDLILMDMIMPVMDGVEATRRIMSATPCPILVVTATVEGNAGKVFEALGAGALDAVATPGLAQGGGVTNAEALIRKVRTIQMLAGDRSVAAPQPAASAPRPRVHSAIAPLVAIGASTGGPLAVATVLKALPCPAPWPIVVVQHVDPEFAPGLAAWLAGETGHVTQIAAAGEPLAPGRVLIAASGDHLVVNSRGLIGYTPVPASLPYRPSVDVFFESLIAAGAGAGVAAVLTGMGRDGAAGLARLRAAGWHTIAQDKATSVVWGMPGACVELGAAVETLPIDDVGGAIAARMASKAPGAHPASRQEHA